MLRRENVVPKMRSWEVRLWIEDRVDSVRVLLEGNKGWENMLESESIPFKREEEMRNVERDLPVLAISRERLQLIP